MTSILAAILGLGLLVLVSASEPELTTDYFVPSGTTVNSSYFTYTGLKKVAKPAAGTVALGPVFSAQFPVLQGLGLSYLSFDFAPGAVVPPHHHPRGSELLYIIQGSMDVGFVDSNNKLFNTTLYSGDVFVFPLSLIHYQTNPSPKFDTKAISAFSNSNPGLIFTPSALFASGIPTGVLVKSLKVSASVVQQLKSALGG